MPLTYSKIKKQDKTIVYLINANNAKVKLEKHHNTLAGTYMGIWINSPIEEAANMFREFPDFDRIWPDADRWLKEHGFQETEPTEIEKLINQ